MTIDYKTIRKGLLSLYIFIFLITFVVATPLQQTYNNYLSRSIADNLYCSKLECNAMINLSSINLTFQSPWLNVVGNELQFNYGLLNETILNPTDCINFPDGSSYCGGNVFLQNSIGNWANISVDNTGDLKIQATGKDINFDDNNINTAGTMRSEEIISTNGIKDTWYNISIDTNQRTLIAKDNNTIALNWSDGIVVSGDIKSDSLETCDIVPQSSSCTIGQYPFAPFGDIYSSGEIRAYDMIFDNSLQSANILLDGTGITAAGGILNINSDIEMGNNNISVNTIAVDNTVISNYVEAREGITIGENSDAGGGSFAFGSGDGSISADTGAFAYGISGEGASLYAQSGGFAGGYAVSGNTLSANGYGAVALGQNVNAVGTASFAMGSGFTNPSANSFKIGFGDIDYDFIDGLANFTSNNITTTGTICDSNGCIGGSSSSSINNTDINITSLYVNSSTSIKRSSNENVTSLIITAIKEGSYYGFVTISNSSEVAFYEGNITQWI